MRRFLLSCVGALALTMSAQTLLPLPQSMRELSKRTFVLSPDLSPTVAEGAPMATPLLCEALRVTTPRAPKGVCLILPYPDAPNDEAYKLRITPDSLLVYAKTSGGVTCAAATLLQLRSEKGKLPCVEISDAPAYAWRGISIHP